MLLFAVYCVLGALFCLGWYWLSLRHHRRKAVQVLRWIEAALAGQGHVVGIRWIAPSKFRVPLRLTCGVFHRAWMQVELTPSEMPLKWLMGKLKKQKDVILFQADLDVPPMFKLGVMNFRWFGRTGKSVPTEASSWTFEPMGPLVMSTRLDWQKDINSAMTSLTSITNREFLNISFQPRSPHFSVTLPLESIAPGSPIGAYMFDTMRELAASSSASLS